MKHLFSITLMFFSFLSYSQDANQTELSWPREIKTASNNYEIILYQPQLESLNQNILEGRMAVSIKDKNDDLIFGALWFKGMLETDKSTRIAVFENIEIPAVKFPDIEDESKLEQLKKVIIDDLKSAEVSMSLDRIIASLENVDTQDTLNKQLNNDAPNIFFRNAPTVLVYIDGKPILEKVENAKIERVVNTPFFLVKRKNDYFIKGGKFWYTSDEILSKSWQETTKIPSEVEKLAEKEIDAENTPEEMDEITTAPDIIVVDTPSELIVTSGKLKYEPISDTSLLLVSNTENDVIVDINSQMHYVLLNGRWYASKSTEDNTWEFVEPNSLPKEFANVPSNAQEFQAIRASIPGTDEAKEAVLENYIPQTATIDRQTATVNVTYDGNPKFEQIEGTDMAYAVNTSFSVLKVDTKFYCVESAVWYVADNPNGPWKVSAERPEAVESIPPNNPVYNVKYVYIYDSTPEVVYVGYTPGYYHSYVYGGVVVYGTGFHYNPWYGRYYYPRPVTYGFGVHYNPYTGWGFSVGISFGWFTYSHHHYHHHGYWGPAGYTHGYRHGYHRGYHHGYHNGYAAGYARGRYDSRNIYRTQNGVKRNTYDTGRRATTQRANLNNSTRRNNVYTDRDGNVMQRNNNGQWERVNNSSVSRENARNRAENSNIDRDAVRDRAQNSNVNRDDVKNRAQQNTRNTQKSSTQRQPNTNKSTNTRPSNNSASQMDKAYQSRSRGNTNYQRYQNNRSRSSVSPQKTRTAPSRSSMGTRRRG